ncbi:hypothetical protein [Halopiger goleimassiliensis]|uniref:hypothetical protein n=1 Tax=Halopiger goleimassiliensis TaxID=1293048 RepID=UPI00067792C7|nr:hypothetical protein [Halopiger goleimassiliensis]
MTSDADPAAVAEAAAEFRDAYDDGEQALRTVLEIDADHETWEFEDQPLDSGTFGELVSRGIVTSVDDGYRLASREGVQAALDGDEVPTQRVSAERDSSEEVGPHVGFDPRAAVALIGALGLLFVTRSLNYAAVVREGDVVPPANDPYYYLYRLEGLVEVADGPTDWSVLTAIPDGERRPLTHATNWFVAELLGGDQWAVDQVVTWLPVVSTIALGVVVYCLTVLVTDDARIGVLSVVLLALTPVHAVYTGVGFLEHRLHQYFWMGVTLLTLAWLAVDVQQRRQLNSPRTAAWGHVRTPWAWLAAVVLGIAATCSAYAWGGSVLMFVPVAAYVGCKVLLDLRADLSPGLANAPLLAGLGISTLLSGLFHLGLGWHEPFTASVPVLVFLGALVAVGFAEVARAIDVAPGWLLVAEGLLFVLGLAAFRVIRPDDWLRLWDRAMDLYFRPGVIESVSLFGLHDWIVLGPLIQVGVSFFVGLVVLGWACWLSVRRYEPGWTLLAVYVLFWLGLAALQGRFAAQLSIPLSILGAVGVVYVLAVVDLARVPMPFHRTTITESMPSSPNPRRSDGGRSDDGTDRTTSIGIPDGAVQTVGVVWIVLLICGVSVFYVPSLVTDTAYTDGEYETAQVIDTHASAVDREYPENYVFSPWTPNRMYNYFVNGEARSYRYAFANYRDFLADDSPDEWYQRFQEDDVGYVVLTNAVGYPETSTHTQLHAELGTGGEDGDPLEHYQAIWITDDTTAFAVVPGAEIVVPGDVAAESDGPVTVEAAVTVSNLQFHYQQELTPNENGQLTARVPYSGEYTVGDRTVEVSPEDVENGTVVTP